MDFSSRSSPIDSLSTMQVNHVASHQYGPQDAEKKPHIRYIPLHPTHPPLVYLLIFETFVARRYEVRFLWLRLTLVGAETLGLR